MSRRKHKSPAPPPPPASGPTAQPVPTRAQRALLLAGAAVLVGWIALLVVLAAGA